MPAAGVGHPLQIGGLAHPHSAKALPPDPAVRQRLSLIHIFFFLKPEELNEEQETFVEDYFRSVLFPVLTPLAVDRSRPFPLLLNKSPVSYTHLDVYKRQVLVYGISTSIIYGLVMFVLSLF